MESTTVEPQTDQYTCADEDELSPTKYEREIELLNEKKGEWANLRISKKIEMAENLLDNTYEVARRQVAEAVEQKGIPSDSPLVGEEWLGGPVVTIRNLRTLLKTLRSIQKTGTPPLPEDRIETNDFGRVVAEVVPDDIWDRLMYKGMSAEVWMKPEVDEDEVYEHMASFYRKEDPEGGVALVLGAGNQASIAPLDVIYKLFAEGQVCLLKMNPVNAYLGPYLESAFKEFIEAGYVQIAYGGAQVGSYLCEHSDIDEIHVTGSTNTYDAIVYGTGEAGQQRKQQGRPKLEKRITSELGNIGPIIVVPGPWDDKDLEFHAENIATQLSQNAGFNCVAGGVIVTKEDWRFRERLIDETISKLEDVEQRVAYYPGAEERYDEFVESHDHVVEVGAKTDDYLPWAILRDIDPEDEEHISFNRETFCSVIGETGLEASEPGEFLEKAVEFCNQDIWGTLNACLIVHPETQKAYSEEVDRAIADLEYGSVVLNQWPAISYGLGVTTWGGFPGQSDQDIQSGRGVVHNTLLFDKPEKSVVKAPFRISPRPPWFVTNRNADRIGEALLDMEYSPSVINLVKLMWHSLWG